MISCGDYFKETRSGKNLSLQDVEARTKIRREFIRAIELEQWDKLPEYPVLFGFMKNLAKFYEMDEAKAMALFRRDYPPQKNVLISPKPIEKKGLSWSPRLTFALGIVAVLLIVATYLGIQYFNFIKPPHLDVIEPTENQTVATSDVKILGRTDPEATIKVNNQLFLVNEEGVFEGMVNVAEETQEIEVKAVSRSGKESVIRRRIQVTLP